MFGQKVLNHRKEDFVQRHFRTPPGLEMLAPDTQIGTTGVLGTASLKDNEWKMLPTGKPFEFSCDGLS